MESALATGNLSTAWIAEVVERFIYRQIPAGRQVRDERACQQMLTESGKGI
jgi:hypothetical protein